MWELGEERRNVFLMKKLFVFLCIVCPLAECEAVAANGECDVSQSDLCCSVIVCVRTETNRDDECLRNDC